MMYEGHWQIENTDIFTHKLLVDFEERGFLCYLIRRIFQLRFKTPKLKKRAKENQ